MDTVDLSRAIGLFSCLDPTHLYAHQIEVLLVIAQYEPCTLKKIENHLGIANSSVSRTVQALSAINRKRNPGYDLITIHRDPAEGRRFIVTLNARGKALIRQLKSV
jgi:DNA-binding MarR family transcriptional regulator